MGYKNELLGEFIFSNGEKQLIKVDWDAIEQKIEEDKGQDDDEHMYIRFEGYRIVLSPDELNELGIDSMEKFAVYCKAIAFIVLSGKIGNFLEDEKNFLSDEEYTKILLNEVDEYIKEHNPQINVDSPPKRNKIYRWG